MRHILKGRDLNSTLFASTKPMMDRVETAQRKRSTSNQLTSYTTLVSSIQLGIKKSLNTLPLASSSLCLIPTSRWMCFVFLSISKTSNLSVVSPWGESMKKGRINCSGVTLQVSLTITTLQRCQVRPTRLSSSCITVRMLWIINGTWTLQS